MKKNGFTLIELIVTIALLGMIGVVISISLTKMTNEQKDAKEKEYKETIEEAACAYAGLSYVTCNKTSGCTISSDTLINQGLVDEEINGISVSGKNVKVMFDNGEKKCSLED